MRIREPQHSAARGIDRQADSHLRCQAGAQLGGKHAIMELNSTSLYACSLYIKVNITH